MDNIFPREAFATGKYFINADALRQQNTTIIDKDLSVLADRSFDYGMLGPNWVKHTDPQAYLSEAVRKLKVGGHLLLLVPNAEISASNLQLWVSKAAPVQQKATYLRDGLHLHIYKILTGKNRIEPPKRQPSKRACIARYGAIGDMVMVTPLIERLARDGYAVTLNITDYAAPVVENNPHVSNIIYQEKDAIPNPELGEYWKEWQGDYDKYINLSESVEGRLLRVEGRPEFYTPKSVRHDECDRNYVEYTMELGGYTYEPTDTPKLYFTRKEQDWAARFKSQHNKRLIVWALAGSSHHKTYAFLQQAIADFVDNNPDCVVVTVGSEANKSLEFSYPNVINQAGRLTLRQTMALVSVADCVVGPESAIVNFASAFSDKPKVVMLSHSTHENLCKHWGKHVCVKPNAACYPCHQLHYTLDSCPVTQIVDDETNEILAEGPACSTSGISVDKLITAINSLL